MCLGIGVFYELFWLDLFPAGTYIPPNGLFSTFMALSLVEYYGFTRPGDVIIPIMLGIPFALFGAGFEFIQRRRQDRNYNAVLIWARQPENNRVGFLPEKLVFSSVTQLFIGNMLLFLAGYYLLIIILNFINTMSVFPPTAPAPKWGHLWLTAGIGAVLSLRVKYAYSIFLIGAGAVVLFLAL